MAYVITIAQQKGGAGKSTVAAHLAVALAQKGEKVIIVDIDPQGSLKHWYEIREQTFGKGYTIVQLFSSSGWRVSSTIAQYKDKSDFIIIDSPPHTETEAKNAIRMADLVIIPMQPSPTDVWATKATVDFVIQERKNYRILLNRYNPNSKTAKMAVGKMAMILENHLGNRVAFTSCLMQGKCVTETDPSSQAAEEVKGVTNEIVALFQSAATPSKNNASEKELVYG
jgi:chromosome partitioning protein